MAAPSFTLLSRAGDDRPVLKSLEVGRCCQDNVPLLVLPDIVFSELGAGDAVTDWSLDLGVVTFSSTASVVSSRLGLGLAVASGSGVWDNDGRKFSGGSIADELSERLSLDRSDSNGESFVGEMDRARSVSCPDTLAD